MVSIDLYFIPDNISLPATPTSALEYQATNDALNYADLERHYWYSLLLFEQHKKNVLALKDRLTKVCKIISTCS